MQQVERGTSEQQNEGASAVPKPKTVSFSNAKKPSSTAIATSLPVRLSPTLGISHNASGPDLSPPVSPKTALKPPLKLEPSPAVEPQVQALSGSPSMSGMVLAKQEPGSSPSQLLAAVPVPTAPQAPPAGKDAAAAGMLSRSDTGSEESEDEYCTDDDDDGSFLSMDQQQLWYRSPKRLGVVVLLLLSVALVAAGVIIQVTTDEDDLMLGKIGSGRIREGYPWLHFFAVWAPLAFSLRWLCWRLYKAAEFTAIREELYFLRPLRAKLAGLLFWLLILLWYQACFKWVWCQDEHCMAEAYQKALDVVWKLLVCLTLFNCANFIKCGLARLLSYQFYRTAHFLKVKEAVERELFLIRLSKARRTLVVSPPTPSPAVPGTGVSSMVHGQLHARLSYAGKAMSTIFRKGSIVFAGGRRGSVVLDGAGTSGAVGGAEVDVRPMPEGHTGNEVNAAAGTAGTGIGLNVVEEERYDGSCSVAGSEGVTAFVQLCSNQQQQQPGEKQLPADDGIAFPLLPPTSKDCSSDGFLSSRSLRKHGTSSKGSSQRGRIGLQSSSSKKERFAADAARAERQPSFEPFIASRVPSLLGPTAAQRGTGSAAKMGSKVGGKRGVSGIRNASRLTASSRVSLPGMVPGVDGLLLQPEMLEEVAMAGNNKPFAAGGGPQPMTEEELAVLRNALGVNTFGAFVDRYYGLSPKEEAAHMRHVKRFAKGLFCNIKGDAPRDHLLPCDFLLFFDGDDDSAGDAFEYFDRNSDGSISCSELQESAVEMLCERKNIAASIKDTDSVVNSLETGLGLLVHFIFFCFYLLVWGVNIVQGFTTFSATVLALTFVFGDSVKGVFESALFLFVEHPYDVGDLLVMPGNINARVKKIDLMYTQLLRGSGELVWHPNSAMRSTVLVNLSRSGPKCETYSWLVDMDTPDEVLFAVDTAMRAHIATQPSHFSGQPLVTWRAMEEPLKLRLAVTVTYSFTGDDVRRHLTVRTGVLGVVRRELARLRVQYTVPPSAGLGAFMQPVA